MTHSGLDHAHVVKDEAVGKQVVVFDDLALLGSIILGDDATAECEPLNKVVE